MTNERKEFFPLKEIIEEINCYINDQIDFDVVTIVGEGEPTLYIQLGSLIKEIKKIANKPVAVITNGALLYDKQVQSDLMSADIVLPSIDFFDEKSYKKINRPHKELSFEKVRNGIIEFSKVYQGNLWIEAMIIKDMNDDENSLKKLKLFLDLINYDRLYINTPIRPPAEKNVEAISNETIDKAVKILNGISIDRLVSEGFYSEIEDDFQAILSIIARHPMNQFEIITFLKTRKSKNIDEIMEKLNNDTNIDVIFYKGYYTYRIKI